MIGPKSIILPCVGHLISSAGLAPPSVALAFAPTLPSPGQVRVPGRPRSNGPSVRFGPPFLRASPKDEDTEKDDNLRKGNIAAEGEVMISTKVETKKEEGHRIIERVVSPEQQLEVMVFRGICPSPLGLVVRDREGQRLTLKEVSSYLLAAKAKAMERMRREVIVQFVAMLPESLEEEAAGDGNKAEDDYCPNDAVDVAVVGAVDAKFVPGARALTFVLPDRVHVENLRVAKNMRRRGIGTELLRAAIRYAMDETLAGSVTLKVERETNAAAVDLYRREGFEFREDVSPGFMIKSLARYR